MYNNRTRAHIYLSSICACQEKEEMQKIYPNSWKRMWKASQQFRTGMCVGRGPEIGERKVGNVVFVEWQMAERFVVRIRISFPVEHNMALELTQSLLTAFACILLGL